MSLPEPVTTAATVIGLFSFAVSVVENAYRYVRSVQKYKHEVEAIRRNVLELSGLLHAVSDLIGKLGKESCREIVTTPDPELDSLLEGDSSEKSRPLLLSQVESCRSTLKNTAVMLRPSIEEQNHFLGNTGKRLVWHFKKSDLDSVLRDLEGHKQSLDLALSTYT